MKFERIEAYIQATNGEPVRIGVMDINLDYVIAIAGTEIQNMYSITLTTGVTYLVPTMWYERIMERIGMQNKADAITNRRIFEDHIHGRDARS